MSKLKKLLERVRHFFEASYKYLKEAKRERNQDSFSELGKILSTYQLVSVLYPLITGLLLTLFLNRISNSTSSAKDILFGQATLSDFQLDAWVLAFWVFVILGGIWVFCQNQLMSHLEHIRIRKIVDFIDRAPNHGVVRGMPKLLDAYQNEISSQLFEMEKLKKNIKDPEELLNSLLDSYQVLLQSCQIMIGEITEKFFDYKEDSLGINIMLFIDRMDPVYNKYLTNPDIIKVESPNTTPDARRGGFLYYSTDLCAVENKVVSSSGESVNEIVFAVPTRKGNEFFHHGPAQVVYNGHYKAPDTSKLDDYFTVKNGSGRLEKHRYFDTLGNNIKSFSSIRIGNSNSVVGVLNVDSHKETLFGTDDVYQSTYRALISPFILLLASPLNEYKELFIKKIGG